MIYGASFLTDVFFAFFGFVTGRHFGDYPAGYPLVGGVLLIGGLLLLAVLVSLLARKIKMPLPPEERGDEACDGTSDDGANDTKGEEKATENHEASNGEVPENRAPRGGELGETANGK